MDIPIFVLVSVLTRSCCYLEHEWNMRYVECFVGFENVSQVGGLVVGSTLLLEKGKLNSQQYDILDFSL